VRIQFVPAQLIVAVFDGIEHERLQRRIHELGWQVFENPHPPYFRTKRGAVHVVIDKGR
jgi:hypothetical protein